MKKTNLTITPVSSTVLYDIQKILMQKIKDSSINFPTLAPK